MNPATGAGGVHAELSGVGGNSYLADCLPIARPTLITLSAITPRPIRAVMVRDIFAVAERFWSDIDALATRLDPADRPAIAGLAITALAGTRGLPPAAARAGVPRTRRLHDRNVSDHLPRGPRCLPPPC
jgi:hypothetical protein